MRRHPGSQTRALVKEKEDIARQLLARGLTITQICAQLNCSRALVRRVKQEREEQRRSEAV